MSEVVFDENCLSAQAGRYSAKVRKFLLLCDSCCYLARSPKIVNQNCSGRHRSRAIICEKKKKALDSFRHFDDKESLTDAL
jgi:hypothetical protein